LSMSLNLIRDTFLKDLRDIRVQLPARRGIAVTSTAVYAHFKRESSVLPQVASVGS